MRSFFPHRKDPRLLARQLRAETTRAEAALWPRLRRKQVLGLRFHRQKPILESIVDFCCPKAGLVIELDGKHHREPDQGERDRQRDEAPAQLDLRVFRFSNGRIAADLDGVVDEIRRVAAERQTAVVRYRVRGGGRARWSSSLRAASASLPGPPPTR